MRRVTLSLVLLTCSFAAGCASHDNVETAALAPTAVATAAPAATAASAVPAPEAAPDAQAAAAPQAGPTVVDGNELARRSDDTLLCRDLLVRGSNMTRRMCGTAAQWKTYERREAQAAAEQVRRMQRGLPEDPADWTRPRRR
jgi:hypothetical protein